MKKVIKQKTLAIEFEREEDGRWIADVPSLPGVMAYGKTKNEAYRNVCTIALRTLADTLEQGGSITPVTRLFDHEVASR